MDTVILDVVIGLMLAYLVLALLVTKVQETLIGQLGTSRKHTLHDMLEEALQGDATLKVNLLQNPLIFALFKGEGINKGVMRAQGPSAIPSDLFARVLLVEVFHDGKNNHPKEKFATPLLFVQNLDANTQTANAKVLGVLRALVAGNEKGWPQYEAAIAAWFDQVGERADGWYQRKAMLWGLLLSFLLAAALNVNTFQLAERLAGDPDLRRSFVALAQRGLDEFGSGDANAAAAKLDTLKPADRAYNALSAASRELHTLFFKNSKYAGFDPNRQELTLIAEARLLTPIQACARAGSPFAKRTNGKTHLLSNPETWEQLMPPLMAEVQALTLPDNFETSEPDPEASAPEGAPAAASQPAPGCKRLEPQKNGCADPPKPPPAPAKAGTRNERLRTMHACLSGLVGWVDKAVGAEPGDATLASGVSAAVKSLKEAGDAVKEMIEDAGSSLLVNQLYRRDPDAFENCAGLPGMTRARLRSCVDSATTGQISLPIGWTGRNIRETFCTVKKVPKDEYADASGCWGGAEPYKGHDGLGIPALALTGPTNWDIAFALAGLVVTALFVALGAPFWFDLLGRFVKMRAAGTPPQTLDQKSTPTDAGSGAAGPGSGPAGGPEPFSDARNDFERLLTIADKMALQTALHVTASGVLDDATRRALVPRAKELGVELANTDELSLLAFLKIVERMPAALAKFDSRNAGSTDTLKQAQGDLLTHLSALAPPLAAALGFPARAPEGGTLDRDELRALAMLYLVKQAGQSTPDPVPSLAELSVLARDTRIGRIQDWPAEVVRPLLALTHDKLAQPELKKRLERAGAKWLDWAFGELGQTQASKDRPEESNPRVVAYLAAARLPGKGDNTDWCGAFLAWVVTQYNAEGQDDLPTPPDSAATAKAWENWGDERIGDPQPGDVVVLFRDKRRDCFHVAFVVEVKSDGSLLVLGGNQDDPGCVSFGRWGRESVFKMRRKPA